MQFATAVHLPVVFNNWFHEVVELNNCTDQVPTSGLDVVAKRHLQAYVRHVAGRSKFALVMGGLAAAPDCAAADLGDVDT